MYYKYKPRKHQKFEFCIPNGHILTPTAIFWPGMALFLKLDHFCEGIHGGKLFQIHCITSINQENIIYLNSASPTVIFCPQRLYYGLNLRSGWSKPRKMALFLKLDHFCKGIYAGKLFQMHCITSINQENIIYLNYASPTVIF